MEPLVFFFFCGVTAISIAYFAFKASMNKDNKSAEVLLKAIETNNCPDADKLAEALRKSKRTSARTKRELLNLRLLRACIFSLLGVAALLYGLYAANSPGNPDLIALAPFFYFVSCASLPVGIGYLITYFSTRSEVLGSED